MGELNEPHNPREFDHFVINANTVERGRVEYPCNPANTVLYLFDPDLYSDYDHIFRSLSEDELPEELRNSGRNMGGFITRHILGEENFEYYVDMITNSCNFKVVYEPVPSESDKKAIDDQMADIFGRELDELDPSDFE